MNDFTEKRGGVECSDRAPVRVCLVAEKFFPDCRGGMELHAYHLAEQLIAHGTDVFAVTRFQLPNSPSEEFVGRVKVSRLELRRVVPKRQGCR